MTAAGRRAGQWTCTVGSRSPASGSARPPRSPAPAPSELALPLGMVAARPVAAHAAERHPAQRVAGGGVEQREIEVAEHEWNGNVHRHVVDQDRAGAAEAGAGLLQ